MKSYILSLMLLASASTCLASSISITTTTVANGTVKVPYSAGIKASGGCTPYKWSITAGSLPKGITDKASSSTTTLNLTGTPTTAETATFTVKVTSCNAETADKSFKIVIQPSANHVVDLSWNASKSDDIAGYNVYRGPNGTSLSKLNGSLVGSTVYTDSSVANNTTYYYATTAVDVHGKESTKTPPVKAVIP